MPNRLKIVISDLHLGAGFETEGNALEDFDSDSQFARFLAELVLESRRDRLEVELIINGDAFELLQVPHVEHFDPKEVYEPERYHSSAQTDSERKIALIIAGHPQFFDALAAFIQASSPRRWVTFIKGNHDLDLHWPAVQDRIRQRIGATGRRTSLLAFEEWRICRDGIYVEHGNQYGEFWSRLDDMEEPYDPDDTTQLAQPVGSRFVTDVLNVWEREKYWVDGVKPVSAMIWYSLVFDFAFAARAVAWLIRAMPSLVADGILAVRDPRTELARDLEDPARAQQLAAHYQADEGFRKWLNTEVGRHFPAASATATNKTPGSTDPLLDAEAMGDRVRQQVQSALFQAACSRAIEQGVKLVVFGHTHEAGTEFMPNGGIYVNSGTWTWSVDLGEAGKQTWEDLFAHPERFTDNRELCYVRIDYDAAGKPQGQLLVYDTAARPAAVRPSWWRWLEDKIRRLWQSISGGK